MDFEKVLTFLIKAFDEHRISYALMGGIALHAAGHTRSTQDLDVLILKEDMKKIKSLLISLGYEVLHESEDVVNFTGIMKELGQIDFILAHRTYTKNMLKRAQKYAILNNKFTVNVIQPEDIIGLKIQSSTNDPSRRNQDLADIEKILQLHKGSLDMALLKEYFALFEREHELTEILKRIEKC